MNVYLIIVGIVILASIIIVLKIRQRYKSLSDELEELRQSVLNGQFEEFQKNKYSYQLQLKSQLEINKIEIQSKQAELDAFEKQCDIYRLERRRQIDEEMDTYKSSLKIVADKDAEMQRAAKEQEANKKLESFILQCEDQKKLKVQELAEIEAQLEEHKRKRDALNEQIRLEQEMENEFDMHRIHLKDDDKDDINFLISLQDKMHNKDLLYKLIWSEYLQKPFNQMVANVVGANIPKNVIYCIEHNQSKKKYIGKTSAEVNKRWTEHMKSSLNIGGIKKTLVHSAMLNHWDEFSFSILEVVPAEQNLSEREKYYIKFFESDVYGFNLKAGG